MENKIFNRNHTLISTSNLNSKQKEKQRKIRQKKQFFYQFFFFLTGRSYFVNVRQLPNSLVAHVIRFELKKQQQQKELW